MGDVERSNALHDLTGMVQNPPSSEVITVAYAIEKFIQSYADECVVDSGFGFGESCLDFWLDGKGIRVVVSATPLFDGKGPV
jgi:hypothetical protein